MANYSKLKQSKIFCLMNQTLQQLNHNFVKHISYYQFFDLKNSFEKIKVLSNIFILVIEFKKI